MYRKIEVIKKDIKNANTDIFKQSQNKFSKQICFLDKQYDLLFEFLANIEYEIENLVIHNNNQFIISHSLFSEMLRKQRLALELILSGDYPEAAEIVRHIMQSCFHIVHLSKNKKSHIEWFKQQSYEEDKLKKSVQNPKTIFSNFNDLLRCLNKANYYPVYRKLCSWSHPSIESLRSNFELSKEPKQIYFFANRFNEEHCEELLNLTFGFINLSHWEGFKDIFSFKNEIPDVLQKYKDIQEEAPVLFKIFYKPV